MSILIITLTSLIILILPGLAIQTWLVRRKQDFAEQLADCIGLSISITAFLFLLTFYFHFHITFHFLLFFYIFCAMISTAGLLYRKVRPGWSSEITVALTLFAAVLLLRFIQIDDLLLPAWVDSVHHVLITRIIAETGAIPSTLEPYLPVPFSYYFGFHGISAVFSMLSGFSAERSVLMLGQVLNACIPLAIYRLGKAMWGNRSRALVAALLVAFVSQMPAYYVTWGRYTLLTGMLLLAIGMADLIERTRQDNPLHRPIQLALITIGIMLTHYFCGVLFALFCSIHISLTLLKGDRQSRLASLKTCIPLVLALALALPWLLRADHLLTYNYVPKFAIPTNVDGWTSIKNYAQYLWQLSGPVRNYLFLLMGIVGIPLMIRGSQSRSVGYWSALLVVAAMPFGVKIPNVRADHIAIVLFFPLAFSASGLLTSLWEFTSRRLPPGIWWRRLAVLPVVAWFIWGAFETHTIINPSTVFVSAADMIAIEWIQDNLPSDARFVINSTLWQGVTYRGVDGGFWLTPLAGIFTVPPPLVYAWGEQSIILPVNSMAERIAGTATCDSEFYKILAEGNFSYIYIKEGVGKLQPGPLELCEGIEVIFSEDGVNIYKVSKDGDSSPSID
jgi:hypothetical protein